MQNHDVLLPFFALSKISNDLSIAVRLASVIVQVAIAAGGLIGPSSADQFHQLMSKKLADEREILASSLKSGDASNQQLSISALAERIGKSLHVKSDEVAILAVSEKWRHLYFQVPQALRNVGHIPLSSTSALAAGKADPARCQGLNACALRRVKF